MWIHDHEEYREIISEVMCTKIPDDQLSLSITLAASSKWQKSPSWLSVVQILDQKAHNKLSEADKALGSVSVHLSLYHASILKL